MGVKCIALCGDRQACCGDQGAGDWKVSQLADTGLTSQTPAAPQCCLLSVFTIHMHVIPEEIGDPDPRSFHSADCFQHLYNIHCNVVGIHRLRGRPIYDLS